MVRNIICLRYKDYKIEKFEASVQCLFYNILVKKFIKLVINYSLQFIGTKTELNQVNDYEIWFIIFDLVSCRNLLFYYV